MRRYPFKMGEALSVLAYFACRIFESLVVNFFHFILNFDVNVNPVH